MSKTKTVAVIGSGITGISVAWHLHPDFRVLIFEKQDRLGGHTHTHKIKIDNQEVSVDSGFIVFNKINYPLFSKWLNILDVDITKSNMSFSFSMHDKSFEWSGKNLKTVFTQKRNLFSSKFIKMLFEIHRFNKICKKIIKFGKYNSVENISQFLNRHKFSEYFINFYLLPMASAIWSTPKNKIEDFPAINLINFFYNHGLLNLVNHFEWYSILGGSKSYIDKFITHMNLKKRDISINLNHEVQEISFDKEIIDEKKIVIKGFNLSSNNNFNYSVDQVVFSCHSDQSSKIIPPNEKSYDYLKDISFIRNEATLHTDESVMPKNKSAWAAWNYSSSDTNSKSLTLNYWMNTLQTLPTSKNLFVSLNTEKNISPKKILKTMSYYHPFFDFKACKAVSKLKQTQGENNLWFAGAWMGYGFHEDGFCSGKLVAEKINNKFQKSNAR